ncbi:MAG: TonB-dependent receptor plug domain-containing protein, partial [Acidobacteriales bacterium]|nr:TonB-dependent receptor plug domain-containing protein [Terriglobales bacterium]
MKLFASIACAFSLLSTIAAAQIRIKVVDPQNSPVAGAQVELLPQNSGRPVATGSTSAEGIVIFHEASEVPFRVLVLAPGFAMRQLDLPRISQGVLTVSLRVASTAETVVVTATRTPIPSHDAAADAEVLNGGELQVMNPVASDDALRFLPGAIVNTAGQRGGRSSLFVEGGDSRYNKVIVDGVPVNESGGTFDFGTLPLTEIDRIEFVRGAQSALYGSDAMTSVVQVWTRTGSSITPELRLGADGGNLGTANGYGSLSGARGRFDYNVFGSQFNNMRHGPNDDYSNSMEGANLGVVLSDQLSMRLRTRHDNSVTGVQGEWNFDGQTFGLLPDLDQRARQDNILASLDFTVATGPRWLQHFTGFESNQKRVNIDRVVDPGRTVSGYSIDNPFDSIGNFNRSGFEYQGDYIERSWARSTFGYRFEDENGFVGDRDAPPIDHGLRLNHEFYGQQALSLGRLNLVAGARFVHNGGFGNTGVPRVGASFLLFRGGQVFSGTRLRFAYATGIKEPRFDESFAGPPYSIPNLALKPERNRNMEAGFQQNFLGEKFALRATYFNNLFQDQIGYATVNPVTFVGQYVNVNKSFAQGAAVEVE